MIVILPSSSTAGVVNSHQARINCDFTLTSRLNGLCWHAYGTLMCRKLQRKTRRQQFTVVVRPISDSIWGPYHLAIPDFISRLHPSVPCPSSAFLISCLVSIPRCLSSCLPYPISISILYIVLYLSLGSLSYLLPFNFHLRSTVKDSGSGKRIVYYFYQ